MAARFVQGFAGGWAMVIGRAVIVDLATGARLVRVLNVIAGVGGIAPIVGPLLGAVILQLSHWRVSFWAVAALGAGDDLAVADRRARDRCPPNAGTAAACAASWSPVGQVLGNRSYVGYLVVAGSAMGALFAYVATSAFVLQSMNGLSPIAYSIDFAANAGGMTIAALVAARLAGRVATRKVILVGQIAALAAGIAMLVGALWFDTPLIVAHRLLLRPDDRPRPHRPQRRRPRLRRRTRPPRHRLRRPRLRPMGRRRHHRPHRRPRRRTHRRTHGHPHDRRRRRLHDRTTRHCEAGDQPKSTRPSIALHPRSGSKRQSGAAPSTPDTRRGWLQP